MDRQESTARVTELHTRWTTTLSSKANLPHAINFRAKFSHVTVEICAGGEAGEYSAGGRGGAEPPPEGPRRLRDIERALSRMITQNTQPLRTLGIGLLQGPREGLLLIS